MLSVGCRGASATPGLGQRQPQSPPPTHTSRARTLFSVACCFSHSQAAALRRRSAFSRSSRNCRSSQSSKLQHVGREGGRAGCQPVRTSWGAAMRGGCGGIQCTAAAARGSLCAHLAPPLFKAAVEISLVHRRLPPGRGRRVAALAAAGGDKGRQGRAVQGQKLMRGMHLCACRTPSAAANAKPACSSSPPPPRTCRRRRPTPRRRRRPGSRRPSSGRTALASRRLAARHTPPAPAESAAPRPAPHQGCCTQGRGGGWARGSSTGGWQRGRVVGASSVASCLCCNRRRSCSRVGVVRKRLAAEGRPDLRLARVLGHAQD